MDKRWIVIGSSFVAALGVLGLTLWLGPSTTVPSGAERPAPPAREMAEPGDAGDVDDDLAPPFDPDRVISREQFSESQIFEDVGGGYTLVEGDRRVLMTWARLTPRPQGVSDVTEPTTWVFLDDLRVLRIAADAGTLVAPRNEPREGQLRGNVVLTLFDARGRSRIELDSLRDVQAQVYLDDAEFDLELGHVESDSPVRLVGRRVEFQGRGLSLTYNELRNRIERLEIAEGESLRFRASESASESASPAPQAYHPRDRRFASVAPLTAADLHAITDEELEEPEEPEEADEPEPTQFYHATFHEAVRVTVGPDRMDMTADRLEALFSFEADPGASAAPADESAHGGRRAPVYFAADQADQAVQRNAEPADSAADADADAAPALFTPQPEDVVVYWTGPLLMLPVDERPADFAGDEDVLLSLVGRPALARTHADETIEGRRIDYLTSTGRLRAERDATHLVRLAGPRLGTLTGSSLMIDQSLGTGHLHGPGTLRAPLNGVREADEMDAAGDELRIAWADRLDLTFHLDERADGDASSPQRLRALRTAAFHGHVETTHPEFDLTTARLDVRLAEPDSDDAHALQRIDAAGDVALIARPADEPPLELDADALGIDLDRDDTGETRPRRITAAGNVRTRQPEQRLRADELELAFAAKPRSESASPGDHRGLERMTALGNVHIELDDPATELLGHRLVADVLADQVELFGRDAVNGDSATLARVVRADATLAGEHIVMRQSDRLVNVDGRGWFDAQLAGGDPADDLRVTWAQSMRYDDVAGHARFLGDVQADTRDGDDRARLTTDDLQLQLADVEVNDQRNAVDGDDEARPRSGDRGLSSRRRIRTATAQGDARFTAEQFDPRGALVTKLRIEGPTMSFDGERESVQVIGAGRMFIEDRRPAPDGDDAQREAGLTGVRFSGRGETLFLWEAQLTLDAGRHDVLMEETVQMLHRPPGERQVMQLDAERLLARFVAPEPASDAEAEAERDAGGGLAGWAGDGAPQLVADLIRAGGAVRILHGPRTVTSDHLQYTRADQQVRLWAEPGSGNLVRVHRADQPTGLSAAQVIWVLERDRFEATELGPGLVPLPE